jgi:hypothetical protein
MKINLVLNYCVRGGTLCDESRQGNWTRCRVCPLCFAVIGTDMVTTGNGPTLPDLAPSTNASSSDVRVGCVAGAMAQDPITENAVRLARAFRISHGTSGWPGLSEEPLSTIGCFAASPPAPASPAWLAQTLLLLPLFIIYADRTRTCLEHPCRPSLTSLTTSSVPSFISCMRQLVI